MRREESIRGINAWLLCRALFLLSACAPVQPTVQPIVQVEPPATASPTTLPAEPADDIAPASEQNAVADIVGVTVSGQPGAYQFGVTISSPDTGCDRYADWWEVVSADGDLVYRRILTHSHVAEQPFSRSGGPVEIQPQATVYIRAHMHPDGYGGVIFTGTVADGFATETDSIEFSPELETLAPQPGGCAF